VMRWTGSSGSSTSSRLTSRATLAERARQKRGDARPLRVIRGRLGPDLGRDPCAGCSASPRSRSP
jgi:hypothetical protein